LDRQWEDPEKGDMSLWYRGQRNAKWALTPGENRYGLLDPDEIRSEFVLKAKELLPRAPETEWEWYFLMQHYGLPTRLLDWTEGSMIALHFALLGNTGEANAAVWVLDPWAINQWSCGCADLVVTRGEFEPDDIASKYLAPVYKKFKMAAKPIAVVPPFNSPRITVQRGAFTVHGSDKRDLEVQFTTKLAKIEIDADSVIKTRRQLRSAGISEFTLFPDLDGLSRDIRATEIDG
jgi:FRG domain